MKYEFFEDKQFVTSKEGKYFIDLKEIYFVKLPPWQFFFAFSS